MTDAGNLAADTAWPRAFMSSTVCAESRSDSAPRTTRTSPAKASNERYSMASPDAACSGVVAAERLDDARGS